MKPFKFLPNRVLRLYTGGSGIDRLCGNPGPADTKFPENWIASCIEGNGRAYHSPGHGISRLTHEGCKYSFPEFLHEHAEEILGAAHLAAFGENPAVLVKLLDSAVQLPLQVHPTREQAEKLFHVPYGKTEAWIVLAARKVNGEEPYVLVGFNENFDKDIFFRESLTGKYIESERMLHKRRVKAGDVILIHGGLPHAIGPGVTMVEVMEPSDLVIVPEIDCFGTMLDEKKRFASLNPETALSIFDTRSFSEKELNRKLTPIPKVLVKKENGALVALIPEQECGYFEVRRLDVRKTWRLQMDERCQVGILVEGNVVLSGLPLLPGDCFMIPASAKDLSLEGSGSLILVLPPHASRIQDEININ